ncbi:MAG: prolyl oligopeptidase family serine peptidase [Ignavibacteria bacterium]|jgi:prolyl oligopeptidase|nr:prolyl oligopeptidase family serine peptidase [Ignavibacteria bacterium]
MKKILLSVIVLFITCTSFAQLNYPDARKTDHTDDYFSTKVEDPYRWMEDLNSPELKTWIEEENKVTFSYLDKIPFRDKIRARLNEIWNYPKYGAPFRIGEYYFFYKNDGMQNQNVLYFQKGLEGIPEVFLDPNTFSTDGTVALSTLSGSKDGRYLVYGISKAGSDWNEFFVMEIATKTKLRDHLKWVKFSGASWLGDGFYYNRYEAPAEGQELASVNKSPRVYFHKAGTDQSEDVLIYEDKEHPEYSFSIYPSEDTRFLYLSKSKKGATGNELYYRDLTKDNSDFIPISTGFVYRTAPVNNIDGDIYLFTNKEAPKNKVVKFNTADGSFSDVIKEKNEVLSGASISHGKFFVQYMVDVSDRIYVYDLNGNQIEELKLPVLGTVSGFSAKKSNGEIFFTFTSFLYPSVIMKYDIVKNEISEFRKSEVKFDHEKYETKQVFYKSKDGTNVPMYIVHKKGIALDGNNPVLLYAYGGFNASMKPSFSTSNIILLENGGVYALANIRGGGEYGKEWHMAGTKLQKQNVFDDFIAAAEYLIDNKYTSPQNLAIEGGSNGGLLVGAVINQRPELFRVAFPAVGVMDMLRFHKFTIGWAWTTDYGSSDDEMQFKYLLGYSPYHNIKADLNYPATMVTTSDHDDRVVPSHSFKYAARLQELYKGENPVLLRVEVNAGHGAGRPTKMIIESQVDKWSFMFYNMGITPKY